MDNTQYIDIQEYKAVVQAYILEKTGKKISTCYFCLLLITVIEEEYKLAIERYNNCLDMRDAKMREVCQSYQAMEEERLAEVKRTLQKVMDLQVELLGSFNQKVNRYILIESKRDDT